MFATSNSGVHYQNGDTRWLEDLIERDRCEVFWEDYGKEQVVFTFLDWVQQFADDAFGIADNAEHSSDLTGRPETRLA